MSRRELFEGGLERRLREETPAAGVLDERAVARVMSRVAGSEPGAEAVYPPRRGRRGGALVAIVAVGLTAWMSLALMGGDGSAGEAPPEARFGEVSLGAFAPTGSIGQGAGAEALVDEGRRVLDDALRLRDALMTRLAALERASGGPPRGG